MCERTRLLPWRPKPGVLPTRPLRVRFPQPSPHESGCPRAAGFESGRGLVLAKLGVCGGTRSHIEVRGLPQPLLRREHSQPLSPAKSSKSLTDFSSIRSASLDVFSLAPGAFPIPWVQNILIRAPCPGQAHLEMGWGVPPGVDQRKPAPWLPPPTPGASGRQRSTSLYYPGESKGEEEVPECRGRRTCAPRARSHNRTPRGKEMGWSPGYPRVRIWGGGRVSGRG